MGESASTTARTPTFRSGAPLERLLRAGLKLRHLQLLVALDDERKLQQAAAALNISQPAASKMLGDIETIVGMPLFVRLARGIEPNIYGEALIRRARAMLAELNQAGEEIAALRAGEGGSVAVGAVMAPAVEALVEAIESVRARLPRVEISAQVETSDVLSEALLASRLDFVIARIPVMADPGPFDYREIGPEDVALVVRASHPLAALKAVTPKDLDHRDWVMQPRGSLLRRALEAMLRRHGVAPPQRVVNTGSFLMTLVMTARTDAIAPMAIPVADLMMEAGNFRRLPLTERLEVEPFGLIRARGRQLSPAAEVLYRAVEARLLGIVGS
ncbi:LysR substrate-binding domain-containing protein [Pseudoxanthobacter sp.]|uniref:LysR substrate-binding domain-containing protein n=1 Tax=Pseudoxanthobacter sp. TaxID=1925742 RepID=UPI002FDF2B50